MRPRQRTLGERINDWIDDTSWGVKLLWLFAAFIIVAMIIGLGREIGPLIQEEVLAREVSVEEYAEIACRGNGLARGATWGEAVTHLKGVRSKFRSVKPPVGLSEYHDARIEGFDAAIRAAGQKDPGERAVPLALIGDADTMIAYRRTTAAENDLPASAFNALRRAGCS